MKLGRRSILLTASVLIGLGYSAMSKVHSASQFGDPLPFLTPGELERFTAGKVVFSHDFTIVEGLGPFFNNTSCAQCHEDPVTGGAGAFNQSDIDIELHATKGDNVGSLNGNFNQTGESEDQSTCNELTAEGGPVFRLQTTGPPLPTVPPGANKGLRATPMLFGFGLIEAIPDDAIEENEGRAGGRVARLPSGRIGRFGRKATDPDLVTFITGAFTVEQGIEVPAELSAGDRDLAVDFVRFLAPPPPSSGQPEGKRLFHKIGCAECHIPTFTTQSEIEALDEKVVHLYSDLLLHDMGPGLADLCKGVATRAEFRTEPLMGLRARTRFLHDGRAFTLDDAIVAHGGSEGTEAANAFTLLTPAERTALLQFLKSL